MRENKNGLHIMLLIGKTPQSLKLELGNRFEKSRLLKNWSRNTLAKHSGVSLNTIKRFETIGQISMENFIALSFALDKAEEINNLYKLDNPQTLEEIRNQNRERGRI